MRFLLLLIAISNSICVATHHRSVQGIWKMYPSFDTITLEQYKTSILDGYLTSHNNSQSFMINGLFVPLNRTCDALVSFSVSWNNGITDLNKVSSFTGLHNCTTDNIVIDNIDASSNGTLHFTKGHYLLMRLN